MDTYDVYIAGSMTGRKVGDVLAEREQAKALLSAYGLTFYCPADDEGLEGLSEATIISNAFDRPRMQRYVTKDLGAVSRSRSVLHLNGDMSSDGCSWEIAFAVFHRFIPVFLVAPQRVSGEKMGFTNILVDGLYNNLQEAVFALNEKLKENSNSIS